LTIAWAKGQRLATMLRSGDAEPGSILASSPFFLYLFFIFSFAYLFNSLSK
jgi:hypothetical protein